MRGVVLLFVCGAGRGLRKGSAGLGDVDGSDEVWIPISPPGEVPFYYSPLQGISLSELPRGAVAAAFQMQAQLTVRQVPAPAAAPGSAPPAAAPPAAAPPSNVSAAPVYPTLVPEDLRHSCVPHCLWNCTEPVCEQNCKPDCAVPSCQTQCPKLGAGAFAGCKVRCGEPNCAMYCPPDPCQGRKTLDCITPKCTTHCEKPKCTVDCGDNLGCKTVCPTPLCTWKCSKPASCPKPKCKMSCEMAPRCGMQTLSVPPPAAGERVMSRGQARMRAAQWELGQWTGCSSQCGDGVRTRQVRCSAGNEAWCPGPRPSHKEKCSEVAHCSYKVGAWSACSAKCGKGTRTRSVECSGPQCLGDRPEDREECVEQAATCGVCEVTLWGGSGFSGWTKTFSPGDYSAPELEYRGVKCDDISSVEVVGDYCKLTAYEFGDFNKAHPGWSAVFTMGKYSSQDFVAAGAKNNDISSFKLEKTG